MGFFDRKPKPQSNYGSYQPCRGLDGLQWVILRGNFNGKSKGIVDNNLNANIGPGDMALSKPMMQIKINNGEQDPMVIAAAASMGITQ